MSPEKKSYTAGTGNWKRHFMIGTRIIRPLTLKTSRLFKKKKIFKIITDYASIMLILTVHAITMPILTVYASIIPIPTIHASIMLIFTKHIKIKFFFLTNHVIIMFGKSTNAFRYLCNMYHLKKAQICAFHTLDKKKLKHKIFDSGRVKIPCVIESLTVECEMIKIPCDYDTLSLRVYNSRNLSN